MRILIAPDSFGGTLSAVAAADAIAAGWRRRAPHDKVVLAPMSDGGAGFVDAIHARLGGELISATVRSAHDASDAVPAAVLLAGDVAYVESAQVTGRRLPSPDDVETATSYGVGELLDAALAAGAARIVVGLGGSVVGDGGAGVLAALGATSAPAGALLHGSRGLESLETVDLAALRDRVGTTEMVAARDRDLPLLGLRGTTSLTGAARGVSPDRLQTVDAHLERLADATDRRLAGAAGAGAGGGMGFALLLAGGTSADGVAVAADAIGLRDLARAADLVVTGEDSFDFESRSGTVPAGVAAIAGHAVRPCIALAGRVLVGSREMRALGIESAYAVDELIGAESAAESPAEALAALAERVARTWSR
jgi:glycerate 2-kinase